jgi:hypothetical protein
VGRARYREKGTEKGERARNLPRGSAGPLAVLGSNDAGGSDEDKASDREAEKRGLWMNSEHVLVRLPRPEAEASTTQAKIGRYRGGERETKRLTVKKKKREGIEFTAGYLLVRLPCSEAEVSTTQAKTGRDKR